MAVSTFEYSHSEETARPSWFRRFMDALIASRTLEAERYVNGYLRSLDDKALESLGFDRKELMKSDARYHRF